MISHPGRIFFSRWEQIHDKISWLYSSTYTLAVAAKKHFFNVYSSEKEWWDKWQVLELHGYNNPTLHFVEYKLFGRHPFPTEVRRFAFYPKANEIVELKILDPYILHRSDKLIPKEGIPGDDISKKLRQKWFQNVEDLYIQMGHHNLIDHPQSNYESGWEDLLNLKGLMIENMPSEDNPFRVEGWKISPKEIQAEISFRDL